MNECFNPCVPGWQVQFLVRGMDAVIWKAKPTRLLLFTAFYLTTLYAFSDELHQILVPHRNFQLQDLGLDALGALLGLGVYWLWRRKSRLVATTRPPPIPSS